MEVPSSTSEMCWAHLFQNPQLDREEGNRGAERDREREMTMEMMKMEIYIWKLLLGRQNTNPSSFPLLRFLEVG